MQTIGLILTLIATVGLFIGLYYANFKINIKKSFKYIGASWALLLIIFLFFYKQ
jgi:hypothetical protein